MKKSIAVLAAVAAVLIGAGVATGAVESLTSPEAEQHQQDRAAVVAKVIRQTRAEAGISARRGPRGPRGFPGPKGATGAPGTFRSIVTVQGPTAIMCSYSVSCSVAGSAATCPAGYHVLGGGWSGLSSPPVVATVAYNDPVGDTGWSVVMANNEGPVSTFAAVARCAA